MIIRNAYTKRERKSFLSITKGKTQQNCESDTNINKIMERAKRGQMPELRQNLVYGDVSNAPDYQQSLNKVLQAQESFMALPAIIRKRFQNDPGSLLEFLQHEENRAEAIKLGLIEEPVETAVKRAGESIDQPSVVNNEQKGT